MIAEWISNIICVIRDSIYPEDFLRMVICFLLGLALVLPWGVGYMVWKRRAKKLESALRVAGQFRADKCLEYVTYYNSHRGVK